MAIDTEKVVKGLNDIGGFIAGRLEFEYARNFLRTIDDALELLKEQEEVEPRRDANCVRMFRCGFCGEYVGFIDSDPGDPNEQDNYCRNCGRKVKWK